MTDQAKLTTGAIRAVLNGVPIAGIAPSNVVRFQNRAVADAATEKAWHARDAEVAEWRGQYAETGLELTDMRGQRDELQRQLAEAMEMREAYHAVSVASLRAENTMKQERDAASEQVRALVEAVKVESDALFNVINGVKKELSSRDWLLEGRGPYRYDDDRYREEAGLAFDAMRTLVQQIVIPARERYYAAMRLSGN